MAKTIKSKSGKEYAKDSPQGKMLSGAMTAENPKVNAKNSGKFLRASLAIDKCIHTFKCMFNKNCEKIAKEELNAMTKSELELVGRDHGIELDKRKTKKALVEQLYDAL